MNKLNFQKQILPHLFAVIVFFLVTFIFYYPLILENKILIQNDINQGVAAGSEAIEFRKKTGQEALWTNSMFSGMPAYLINVRWTGSAVLDSIQEIFTLYLPSSMRENFLAFIGFYILLLVFGIRPYMAIAGALAFGLSTFFVVSVEAGHIWKVRAIAYMPMILAGVHAAFSGRIVLGFFLTAFSLGLQINSNHPQISYYLLLLLIIYAAVHFVWSVKEKELSAFFKTAAVLAMAAIIAIGMNLGKLWATLEYGKYSIRGKSELTTPTGESSGGLDRDYAFRWSSGKYESFTMLVPHLYGGASGVYVGKNSHLEEVLSRNNVPRDQIRQYEGGLLGYWGSQPGTAGPVYLGAVMCFLFVLAFFFLERKHVYWLTIATVFSILLSWGNNLEWFNYFIFDHLPGYNKFRSVTMAIIIALVTMPLMGMLGLERFLASTWNKETQKKLLIALGITAGLALLLGLLTQPPALEGDQWPGWLKEAVADDRKNIIMSDAFRSILFIGLTFLILLFYKRAKINFAMLTALLVLLTALDLGSVDKRYLNADKFDRKSKNQFLAKTEADERILQDPDIHYRVFNLQGPFAEARTSAFHKSIGGYHGAKIRRYQDLIERQLEPEQRKILADKEITRENTQILSMLNTKYILAGTQRNAVIANPFADGNAWFVKDIVRVNSPDEEIEQLGSIDPSNTAVLDVSKFEVPVFRYDSSSSITLSAYRPNYLKYESRSGETGLAVFSEIYYPEGWQARIDGNEAEILRANYVLRALIVPAGDHTIEFEFAPKSYNTGNLLSQIFTWIFLLSLIGYVAVKTIRTNRQHE